MFDCIFDNIRGNVFVVIHSGAISTNQFV